MSSRSAPIGNSGRRQEVSHIVKYVELSDNGLRFRRQINAWEIQMLQLSPEFYSTHKTALTQRKYPHTTEQIFCNIVLFSVVFLNGSLPRDDNILHRSIPPLPHHTLLCCIFLLNNTISIVSGMLHCRISYLYCFRL